MGKKITKWLSKFFSICLKQCHMTKLWRKANVIAVLKPGRRTDEAKSYHPISLLCVPFKLLERIILARMIPFVEAHLPETQLVSVLVDQLPTRDYTSHPSLKTVFKRARKQQLCLSI